MRLFILLLITLIASCGHSQSTGKVPTKLVGGPCEGCEAIFEFGNKKLASVDTLPDFNDDGQKIKVTGNIYNHNGTPADDVILYIYHTNANGIYAAKQGAKGWEIRHGSIRGWMKTDKEGKYTFYTLIPGRYPDRSSPAHIHLTILEPNGKYYWLGSYYFNGDSLLTQKDITPKMPRGGSTGVLTLKKEGNIHVGTRDILLGKNVPKYN